MIEFSNVKIVGCEEAVLTARNAVFVAPDSDSKMTYESPRDAGTFLIGKGDLSLMNFLSNRGLVDARFRKMITLFVDIEAPIYWWNNFMLNYGDRIKVFDTYSVNLLDHEFTFEDFSCEHLFDADDPTGMYYSTITEELLGSKDVLKIVKIFTNYEDLAIIYRHLEQQSCDGNWLEFKEWIEKLPYSEIITNNKED